MTTEQPHQAIHQDELVQLLDFLKKNGKQLAITAILAAVVAGSIFLYRNHRRTAQNQAASLYGKARTPQEFEALLSEHDGSSIAPLACLGLAKSSYNTKAYSQAMKHYETFIQKYPEHELIGTAEVGRLHCLEAVNRLQDALVGFQRFEKENPKHYLRPIVRLGQARCLEQLRDYKGARQVYEEFTMEFSGTDWSELAEQRLQAVEHIIETGATGPAHASLVPSAVESEGIFTFPGMPEFNLNQP